MASFVQYNATMATASMTMASHSVDHNPSVTTSSIVDQHRIEPREESIEKLKSNLVRYGRSNDRRMVLRSLKDVKFLSYILLEAPDDQIDIPLPELEKEVSQEKVVLNDVLLKPRNSAERKDIKNSGTNNGCTTMVKALAQVLCENSKLNENTLYVRVLARLAKTSASTDVHFQLNAMMGSTELIVQELSSIYLVKPTPNSMNNSATNKNGDATNLKLYNSGGQIHMILETTLNFGLFRKSDVIINRPWIVMKCKVHERANLSTNESFRSLNVKTPSLY